MKKASNVGQHLSDVRLKKQGATLIVVIITSFITTFTGSALNLSIPSIGQEYQASAMFIGWIVTGYILASAVLSVPFGRIADLKGRKGILVTGISLFTLCAVGCAGSWSIESLVCFRVLQGVGAAMIFSTNTAVLISAFSPEKRGKVLGYSIASTYIGLSAGPVVGGFFNHYLGWRSIFLATAAISAVVCLVAAKQLPKSVEEQKGETLDTLGMVLYVTAITATMYGLSSFSSGRYAKYLILSGVLIFVLFVWHELKVKHPIIEVRLFRHNIGYAFSNLAALMNYGATFAVGYLLSIYFQVVMGFTSQTSGLILISQPLIMAILSPYAGKLSDRVSPFKLASLGMGLCTAGLCLLIFISANYPLVLIIVALMIVGTGFAFFSSPNTNAVMACVDQEDYGVASSVLATMRLMGHSLSMAIVTFIVAHRIGNVTLSAAKPEQLIETMHSSFLICTCICAVGIFISLARKREKE